MMQGKFPGPRFTPFSRAWPHRFWLLGLLALGLSACAQPQSTTTPETRVPPLHEQSVPWTSANPGAPGQLSVDGGDNVLGNQTWSSASNGYGPIEYGASNGGAAAGDGKALTIGGVKFARGFGTHADSQMTFALNRRCATFTASVGVDDEVGWQGSVVFQVFGDGVKLFESGVLTGKDAAKSLNVNVAGKNELKLVVGAAGNGQNADHADWAMPTLHGCVAASPEAVYSAVQNGVSAAQPITVGNHGSAPLRVTSLAFVGKDAGAFELVAPPALPLTLAPGQNLTVQARFNPRGAVGALSAALSVKSDDPAAAPLSVSVYGLSARGLQGDLEPPLQQIVDTLGYAIDVGGSDLVLGTQPTMIGDEVAAGLFTRAESGPVTLRAVARYSPDDLLPFGYYTPGGAGPELHQVAVIARGGAQTLMPPLVSDPLTSGNAVSFDPGSATFGFYAGATGYAPQNTFTQDALNSGPTKHGVRVYPLKNRAGQPVAGSYLLAFEPAVNGDYQDYVFVVSNVKPAAPAPSPAPADFVWTARADAPLARSEAQGAAVNGKLYVFGGFDTNLKATKRSDVYDPATDRWTALPDMPEPSTHVAVAADGQTLYFAGGFIGDHPGPQTNHVWKYNIAARTWSKGPALPAARGAGAMVRLGRELHFFGGTERDTGDLSVYKRDSGNHWVLQLDGGTSWTPAPSLPNPRNHTAGVALNGKIYAIGGQHLGDEIGGDQSEVDVYDPAKGRWTQASSLPLPLGHINASTVLWNGHIVVLAGLTLQAREAADVFEYDPSANTWTERAPLPGPRKSPVAGDVGNRLLVTGGTLMGDATATTWSGAR